RDDEAAANVVRKNGSVARAKSIASNGNGNRSQANGVEPSHANGATVRPAIRFILHESPDEDADRVRLDALIEVLRQYPGGDDIRLFVHARDGDRIELTMPSARACEELRVAGIAALAPQGDAEIIGD